MKGYLKTLSAVLMVAALLGISGGYQNIKDGQRGTALSDETAQAVDEAVKKINPEYSVFVKHWIKSFMPPTYRGQEYTENGEIKNKNDMIFVTDSQGFHGDKSNMRNYYKGWADEYYPNPVFFQIAYENDEDIWKSYSNPLKEFGQYILNGLSNKNDQKRGIIWVDFTLKEAWELSQ